MSLDKLIAAATDYFSTGAEVHRRALAGGNTTEMSEPKAEKPATKTVATKAKDTPTPVEKTVPEAVTDVVVKPVAPVAASVQVPVPDAVTEAQASADAKVGPQDDGVGDLEGAPVIDYEADIRPLIRTKTLVNRDGLVALLGTFGVKSGAELSQVQHAEFLAALKAL
jgi:hypothetical protein